MSHGKLAGVCYRVRDPETLATWYRNVLGFVTKEEDNSWICECQGEGARIVLRKSDGAAYTPERDSVYWKIGLALPDVNLAREKIIKNGVSVTSPSQFMDIGYLCHLADPEGFSIELLQHTFEANFQKPLTNPQLVLGQEPFIGQVTLRCSDIKKSLDFYETWLGMKLLSIQDVEPYGFTLYFLAFTDDIPPHKDLNHVGIREWLWQRPYTTLELQCRPGKATKALSDSGPGVESVEVIVPQTTFRRVSNLSSADLARSRGRIQLTDPDGAKIIVSAK